jgi:hypothetical protein
MVQRRAARYTCNRYHNTSSVTEMLQTLHWSTLEKRRIRTRIIFLCKIIHHLVVIYPTILLTRSDPRTRQFLHRYSYRLVQTTKDSYKVTNFPKNNITMEPPTSTRTHYSDSEPTGLCSFSLMLSGEVTNTNFKVFGLTRPGFQLTIYRTQGEHANKYATDAVDIRIRTDKIIL